MEHRLGQVQYNLKKKTEEFQEKSKFLEEKERLIEQNNAKASEIRQKSELVRQQIHKEEKLIEEAKNVSTFFTEIDGIASNAVEVNQFDADTKAFIMESLEKKISLKEQALEAIQPVVDHLKNILECNIWPV